MAFRQIDKRHADVYKTSMKKETFQKNLPPLIGIFIMVGAAILLRRLFFLAIPIGALAWWGSAAALERFFAGAQGRRRARVKALPDARTRQDMSQALAKVERLQALNAHIPDETLTAALNKLAEQANFLIDETVRTPNRANAAHKALAIYLDDAVELAQRFADLQRFAAMGKEEIRKTTESITALTTLFQIYAQRMRKAEALDLDIKITVLEDRLRAEGIFNKPKDQES